jgi:hypothetical protein
MPFTPAALRFFDVRCCLTISRSAASTESAASRGWVETVLIDTKGAGPEKCDEVLQLDVWNAVWAGARPKGTNLIQAVCRDVHFIHETIEFDTDGCLPFTAPRIRECQFEPRRKVGSTLLCDALPIIRVVISKPRIGFLVFRSDRATRFPAICLRDV